MRVQNNYGNYLFIYLFLILRQNLMFIFFDIRVHEAPNRYSILGKKKFNIKMMDLNRHNLQHIENSQKILPCLPLYFHWDGGQGICRIKDCNHVPVGIWALPTCQSQKPKPTIKPYHRMGQFLPLFSLIFSIFSISLLVTLISHVSLRLCLVAHHFL